MKILSLDLGKFKSVACIYNSQSAEHSFVTIPTRSLDVHDLLAEASATAAGHRDRPRRRLGP